MVLGDVASGWVSAMMHMKKPGDVYFVELEDRRDVRRSFPFSPGFWFEGRPIETLPPRPAPAQASPGAQVSVSGRHITGFGSSAPASSGPKVAKCLRTWIERCRDAEFVQYVWDEGLAEAGAAVQLLGSVDNLEAVSEAFGPTSTVCAGVLVDHMVSNSGESRIAEAVSAYWLDVVLALDHPLVDI